MPAPNAISADKLMRLIGLPSASLIVDARPQASDPDTLLVPASVPWPSEVGAFPALPPCGRVVVICEDGRARSQGVAATLRASGVVAEVLDGGINAWDSAALPTMQAARLPARGTNGSTRWITRARPKVDRIACPWLIRRFVDPLASFLFVPSADVLSVARSLSAEPFDVTGDGIRWTHVEDRCSFDSIVDGFGLGGFEALGRLARIVRGADTGHPELAPEASGLLAASLGLSRMFDDDNAQLEAGMLLYDALYRWCRDATGEAHDWKSHVPPARRNLGQP